MDFFLSFIALVILTQDQAMADQQSTATEAVEAALRSSTENDISFLISNRANRSETQVSLRDSVNIVTVSQFNISLDAIIVIHGWISNHSNIFNTMTIQAYLTVRDVNIINVNWDRVANDDYLTAYMAVPNVALYVAQFIQNISKTYDYSLDKVTLVGHSLGAHISGYVGQYTNGVLPVIIGLDPAGPLYFKTLPNTRLSSDDAKYVQAIHSNAGLFGITYDVGDADFWPNGGSAQPGCIIEIPTFCSHIRSFYYFAESILTGGFVSRQCGSYVEYGLGRCSKNAAVLMGGACVNTTAYGNFYLKTSSTSPYALGVTDL